MTAFQRDHGGGLDTACAEFGGSRIGWADLSTGINPHAYPVPRLTHDAWTALPDTAALQEVLTAARNFWNVPDAAAVLAAPGASSIIAQIPTLVAPGKVNIPAPTYNEHAAAFAAYGWTQTDQGDAEAQVLVHPNNPDGRLWTLSDLPAHHPSLTVIDESFCDTLPGQSLMHCANSPGTLVLKSFGKFWGLAGLRLGFAMGGPDLIARLQDRLGPWAVAGPALQIGTAALTDHAWAASTRTRLRHDSARLDGLMRTAGARVIGGTSLFRLYHVEDAHAWQRRLAHSHIWSRIFPYNPNWLRLGLPHALHWSRLEDALG